MTRVTNAVVLIENTDARALQAVFCCDECKWFSIGLAEQQREFWGWEDENSFIERSSSVRWLPRYATSKSFPDVPSDIGQPASEAYECRSIGAYRAAVLLARAVIEATAKRKGITTGQLASKIDQLCEQGFIRSHVREAAHEARHLGNDMAHGDFDEPVDQEGADDVLLIMDEVLLEVFQSPARTERLRRRRAAPESLEATS